MIRATVLHPHAAAICSPLRWITGARPSETNWQSFQKVRLLGRLSARFRSASAVNQNIQKAPPQHRETAPPSQSAHSASNGCLQTSLEATLQEIQASPSFKDPDIGAQVKDPASGPIIHLPSDPRPWENEREYSKYRMRVAYDGTNYWGWQIQLQSGLPTVQGRIEEALMTITREPRGVLRVLAAGRTDAGVHARGQVAHFFTSSPLEDLESIHLKLNGKNIVESPYSSTKLRPKGVLPVDIRILELAPVTHDFHARFSAISKIYHYSIATKPVIDPLSRLYSAHVFYEVDIDRIKEGALHFVGEHDFAAFANFYPKPRRDVNADTVRTITRFDVVDTEEGVRLEIEGTGFLYRQVRNMVGLLVEIGRGQYEPSIVPKIMELRNRRLVPTSAPAHGLVMQSVAYPEELLKPPPGASAASTGRLVRKPSQKSKLEAQLAAI